MYGVLFTVQVVAREQYQFDSLVSIVIIAAVELDSAKTLLVKTQKSSARFIKLAFKQDIDTISRSRKLTDLIFCTDAIWNDDFTKNSVSFRDNSGHVLDITMVVSEF